MRRYFWILLLGIIVSGGLLCLRLYQRPVPATSARPVALAKLDAEELALAWPAYGQAAIGTEAFGVLESHNAAPAPIASLTKVMTALAVLKQKPLDTGEQGPLITLTEQDAAEYHHFLSQGGAAVPVEAGGTISQYQALQALMHVSANNIANTLARWAFGSEEALVVYANELAKSYNMQHSRFVDPSGWSPENVATADDVVRLGIAALDQPVLAEIITQDSADIPFSGVVLNYNMLFTPPEIIAIKAGLIDESGNCFLFASRQTAPDGQALVMVGAIMGAPDFRIVRQDSKALADSTAGGFEMRTILTAGQIAGEYQTPWGGTAKAVVRETFKTLTWKGLPVQATAKLTEQPVPVAKDTRVGAVRIASGLATTDVPVFIDRPLLAPSVLWRMRWR